MALPYWIEDLPYWCSHHPLTLLAMVGVGLFFYAAVEGLRLLRRIAAAVERS